MEASPIKTAIFVHQFDLAGGNLEVLRQSWPGILYVKAIDGPRWMSQFDTNPDHVTGIQGGDSWTWQPSNIIPWTVPTDDDPATEGRLTGLLAARAGGVVLDLEPYNSFWHGNLADAQTFMNQLRATDGAEQAPVGITLDHRRYVDSHFPPDQFLYHVDRVIPQVYWTDFQKPWQEVLDEANAALAPIGVPIELALPGNADPADFRAALEYARQHGQDVSVWVWQSTRAENLAALIEYSQAAAPGPVEPDCADYINLLGYLQGDVAEALRASVKKPKQAFLDALYALRTTGQPDDSGE